MMNTDKLKTVGKVGAALAGLVAVSLVEGEWGFKKDKIVCGEYSEAVRAILESDMFDYNKQECLAALQYGRSSEIYKAVISIVNSDSFSSTKVQMIKDILK